MIDHILNAIDEELARLHEARALLADSRGTALTKTAKSAAAPSRRTLSPKARRAIGDAQRKRWAKARKQKKATTPAKAVNKESAAN